MLTRHTRGKVTWIDLESPTETELHDVMVEFGISPHIEDEIISPTPYPVVISFPTYVYLILHFPIANADGGARSQEIDFIVGKRFMITVRYEVVDSIHNLHKVFEAEELLGLPASATDAEEALVEQVFRRMFRAIRDELETTERNLEKIEEAIFAGKERATVRKISDTGRVLLRFETILRRNAEPLAVFLAELKKPGFFGAGFAKHSANIDAERLHVTALIHSFREVSTELRITNDSLLSTSQNEVMKTLTIMAFVTFPLTLIAGIFSMDTHDTPLVGVPHDFWYVIGIMLLLCVAFFTFFRLKKWL